MKKTILIIGAGVIAFSCSNPTSTEIKTDESVQKNEISEKAKVFFAQLPEKAENPNNIGTPEKVKLGKILYFDNRLSKDQTQSCNTCHNLESYGVDNLPTSPGDNGGNGTRNSPTTFNAALHFAQFWDGRNKDVEEQAGGPVLNPVEMAMPSEEAVEERLSEVDMYQNLFKAAYPESENAITYQNMRDAIGVFERTLLTPSKFDNFIAGDETALNEQEQKGLKAFMDNACTTCHSGALLGGNMLQKFALFGNYWELTNSAVIDTGKYQETRIETDKFMFKVPSLRNIEMTAPYFHDGSVADLKDAVRIMGKTELNKDISEEDLSNIVVFLNTLTADISDDLKTFPEELKE